MCTVVFVMLMAVCASVYAKGNKEQAPAAQPKTETVPVSLVPAWANEQPAEDANVFWGVGYAKLQNGSLAQRTATAYARRDVAMQLNVLVQGMLTDYARESGTLNDPASIIFIEDVGRSLVNNDLSGAAVTAREQMPDGSWWIRVSLQKTAAKRVIANVVENEASRYAAFSASEALNRLDFELDKARSKPTPQTE